jgi:hypothetical protein
MVIKSNRITYRYQKSGAPLGGSSHEKIFHLQATARLIEKMRRQTIDKTRVFVPTNELYDIAIEIVEELILLVSSEHRRHPRLNVDVEFSKDELDELGNPKITRFIPKNPLVASDQFEVGSLHIIAKDLISLKRNRRPSRSLPNKPCPGEKKRSPQGDDKKKRRKRYLYTKKELNDAKAFYGLLSEGLGLKRSKKGPLSGKSNKITNPIKPDKNVYIELK